MGKGRRDKCATGGKAGVRMGGQQPLHKFTGAVTGQDTCGARMSQDMHSGKRHSSTQEQTSVQTSTQRATDDGASGGWVIQQLSDGQLGQASGRQQAAVVMIPPILLASHS